MSESVIPDVIEQMLGMPDDLQRRVLAYVRTLRASEESHFTGERGTPGQQMVRFAGIIPPEDLKHMQAAIEMGCEQVDRREW